MGCSTTLRIIFILLAFRYILIGLAAQVQADARNLNEEVSGFANSSQLSPRENPFPFISFSKDGQIIVEAQLVEQNVSANQLTCQNTISLLMGQSIIFRSPSNYSSLSQIRNLKRVTCFNSPPGTKINITCENFNLDCDQDHFGISFGENVSHVDAQFCGNDPFSISEQLSESNKIKIIFRRRGISSLNSPSSFTCHVSQVGFDSVTIPSTRLRNSESGCTCGRRNVQPRIVGGVKARPNEFPWRCYILWGNVFMCGCSLISNRWVMTAAHCTQFSGQINIVFGSHDMESESTVVTIMRSGRVLDHPMYINRGFTVNDISLIELTHQITLSREISPVCLPWNLAHRTFVGSTAVTGGWGRTNGSNFNSGSSTLLKVNLPVVSNRQCARVYGNIISADMICGFLAGRGTCGGDSGGSMELLQRNSRYYAIGITSWGDGPCVSFSVFARVTHFLNWIQETTQEDFCRI